MAAFDRLLHHALVLTALPACRQRAGDDAAGAGAIVCTSAVRPLIADFLARSGLRINVFSYVEIPSEIRLVPAGVVEAA